MIILFVWQQLKINFNHYFCFRYLIEVDVLYL